MKRMRKKLRCKVYWRSNSYPTASLSWIGKKKGMLWSGSKRRNVWVSSFFFNRFFISFFFLFARIFFFFSSRWKEILSKNKGPLFASGYSWNVQRWRKKERNTFSTSILQFESYVYIYIYFLQEGEPDLKFIIDCMGFQPWAVHNLCEARLEATEFDQPIASHENHHHSIKVDRWMFTTFTAREHLLLPNGRTPYALIDRFDHAKLTI